MGCTREWAGPGHSTRVCPVGTTPPGGCTPSTGAAKPVPAAAGGTVPALTAALQDQDGRTEMGHGTTGEQCQSSDDRK